MKDSIVADNIMIPDFPIEANYGQWAMEHPECDSVAEQIGTGTTILIYAYATSKDGNKTLRVCRDRMFTDKKIFKGVSLDGIRTLI